MEKSDGECKYPPVDTVTSQYTVDRGALISNKNAINLSNETINTNKLGTTGTVMDFGIFGKKDCDGIIFEPLNVTNL